MLRVFLKPCCISYGEEVFGAEGKVKSVSVANLSHPNSRKVRQLTKQAKKETARKKSKMVHQMKLNVTGEKFLWFQTNLPADVSEISHGTWEDLMKNWNKYS
ncbi:translation machinery-associated protein 16-like [Macrosteles quadrilineatus]|uniref:translation machinery-associated protein 16-like n=1 Tax=Macrosteles quadrilineatus TaxID=74068 RepID=UPI0023E105B2|nr:translation machinery-associated protein 16-like [Macrosteles quadrilineatus]